MECGEINLGNGVVLRKVGSSTSTSNSETGYTIQNLQNLNVDPKQLLNALYYAIASGINANSGGFANITKFMTLRVMGYIPELHSIYLGGSSLFGKTTSLINGGVSSFADKYAQNKINGRPINEDRYNVAENRKVLSNWQIDEFPELSSPLTNNSLTQLGEFVASCPLIITGVRMLYDGSTFVQQSTYPIKFIDTVRDILTTEIFEHANYKSTFSNMANNQRSYDYPFSKPIIIDSRRALEITIEPNFVGQIQIGYGDFGRLADKNVFDKFVSYLSQS
ncbi:MAG: hypothetical protein NZM44_00915 [Candidatus Calescibacterium sp.]|nr:hypothetical protein [Candidatus Calescibacterium sp.]